MKYLGKVRVINLVNTNITNIGLAHLREIREINFSCTATTREGLKYLTKVSRIHLDSIEVIRADLKYLQNVGDISFYSFGRSMLSEANAIFGTGFIINKIYSFLTDETIWNGRYSWIHLDRIPEPSCIDD